MDSKYCPKEGTSSWGVSHGFHAQGSGQDDFLRGETETTLIKDFDDHKTSCQYLMN